MKNKDKKRSGKTDLEAVKSPKEVSIDPKKLNKLELESEAFNLLAQREEYNNRVQERLTTIYAELNKCK